MDERRSPKAEAAGSNPAASTTYERIDPDAVAQALGAEPLQHTCIHDDGGTALRRCLACAAEKLRELSMGIQRRLLPLMVAKRDLVAGAYYIGRCRNATVARWDGAVFRHWRRKFGRDFVESIKHPDDDAVFDVFVPVARCDGHEVREVPLDEEA